MKMLLHEIRFSLLALVRNPRARVMTLAFPLILLIRTNHSDFAPSR